MSGRRYGHHVPGSCRIRNAKSSENFRDENVEYIPVERLQTCNKPDQMPGPIRINIPTPASPIRINIPTPEVVLEIPSDSDSSRRPSHCSAALSEGSPSPSLSRLRQASLSLDIPCHGRAARRASFGGGSLQHRQATLTSHLDVPQARERVLSLPSPIVPEELYMLRSFSIEGKKVVNRGDSVRVRRCSGTSWSSRGSRCVSNSIIKWTNVTFYCYSPLTLWSLFQPGVPRESLHHF